MKSKEIDVCKILIKTNSTSPLEYIIHKDLYDYALWCKKTNNYLTLFPADFILPYTSKYVMIEPKAYPLMEINIEKYKLPKKDV